MLHCPHDRLLQRPMSGGTGVRHLGVAVIGRDVSEDVEFEVRRELIEGVHELQHLS